MLFVRLLTEFCFSIEKALFLSEQRFVMEIDRGNKNLVWSLKHNRLSHGTSDLHGGTAIL